MLQQSQECCHLQAQLCPHQGSFHADAEHYGFILDTNPHDFARLPPALFERAAGQELQLAGAECYLHSNGAPSWQLMRALRLAFLPGHQRKSLGYKAFAGEPCSPQAEVQVYC